MSGTVHWSPVANQHSLDMGFESCSSFRATLTLIFERDFPMVLDRADLPRLEIVAKIKGEGKSSENPYQGLVELITQVGLIELGITY